VTGVDLRPGWTGVLIVNGVEIPEDQLDLDNLESLGQVLFTPGDGKAIEQYEAGENCVTAVVWRVRESRAEARQVGRGFKGPGHLPPPRSPLGPGSAWANTRIPPLGSAQNLRARQLQPPFEAHGQRVARVLHAHLPARLTRNLRERVDEPRKRPLRADDGEHARHDQRSPPTKRLPGSRCSSPGHCTYRRDVRKRMSRPVSVGALTADDGSM